LFPRKEYRNHDKVKVYKWQKLLTND